MTTATAIPHERALEIVAAAPAFRPIGAEAEALRRHLGACPACASSAARMRAELAAIGRADPAVSPRLHDLIREAAVTKPRTGPSLAGIVVVLALIAVGVVGASIGVGALTRPDPPVEQPRAAVVAPEPGDALFWSTDTVDMAARTFWIDANGERFTGVATPRLTSDPGDAARFTLEASWTEHDREQRLFLYFGRDEQAWWIDRVAVYDGAVANPDWASFDFGGLAGRPATTPLGAAFTGDLVVNDIPSATGPVDLHLGGVRIAVHQPDLVMDHPGSHVLAGDGENPFRPGGSLRCSGILQLPPQAAEARLLVLNYALSWRLERSTGPNTGFSQAMARAPDRGYISDTAVGSSGELIVFVQDPTAPLMDAAATLPPDCASGS